MPPDLLVLGDHLELAARRAVGRRRTRRHQVLNALTSLAIAVPLVAGALQTIGAPAAPVVVIAPNAPSYGHKGDDLAPRLLHRVTLRPSDDVLYETTTMRRALR